MKTLEEVVTSLEVDQETDITGLFPTGSDVLSYKDGPAGKPDICTTKVTLNKKNSNIGSVTMFNIFEDGKLILSEFYYEDQEDELLDSLHKWLTI